MPRKASSKRKAPVENVTAAAAPPPAKGKRAKAETKPAENGAAKAPAENGTAVAAPPPARGKRAKAEKKPVENGAAKAPARAKRAAKPKPPPSEPEYVAEKRNLEDLWQAAFPVGTEWDNMEKLREINWSFKNLEDAFKEPKTDEKPGELYGKTVYLFGSTEAQLLAVKGEQKVILIPIVVAVISPIPPSDKIGVKSVQRETEDIIPMKAMKMAWIPYIPFEDRQSPVDRLKTQIFTLGCNQRRSALKHLKIERIKQYDYCLPYLQPLKADDEEETTVDIMYPLEPPVVCEFDWELDDIEEFTEELIKEEALPEDQKDAFKEYVKEQVRARKKAQREVREARKKAIDDMNPETKAAFENMLIYKFYPEKTDDTPDISEVQVPYINRYYGKAHKVFGPEAKEKAQSLWG